MLNDPAVILVLLTTVVMTLPAMLIASSLTHGPPGKLRKLVREADKKMEGL